MGSAGGVGALVREIENRGLKAPVDASGEGPEERLAEWWMVLSQAERGGLAVLGGQPMSCAYEDDFMRLDDKERAAILHSLKSAGVVADLVMYGSHGPLRVAS